MFHALIQEITQMAQFFSETRCSLLSQCGMQFPQQPTGCCAACFYAPCQNENMSTQCLNTMRPSV